MKKFYEKTSFKREQKKWYDKLKNKGFYDIERAKFIGTDTPYLARDNAHFRKVATPSKIEHFRRCGIHYHHHDFRTQADKKLFGWYKDGKTFREMVELYNKRRKHKRSIYWIHTRIHEMLEEMNEHKYWEDE